MAKRKKAEGPPPKEMAALYIRVSTDAQAEEGFSIEAQRERLEAYAKAKGIERYEHYIDGGFSGSNLNRPEIQRLIRDAAEGRLTHVIVYKLDRISRSQRDTLYLIEDVFLRHGIAFISLNESFDTSTPFGRAVIGILSVFAQLERENIFERTRMGMQKRVESGLWMGGGRVPFGYDYDADKGILVPNQDAEKVRQVYELYLQGYSLQKIADMLGLKYERLARQILTRKSNAGYITYNGTDYKGLHEPIVPLEVYEQAMEQMRTRALKKFVSATNHLLTGLVYCGKCGARMRYQKWGTDGHRFVCYSQQRSKRYLIRDPSCDNKRIRCDLVEREVCDQLFRFASGIEAGAAGGRALSERRLEMMRDEYEMLSNKVKRLYNLYAEEGNRLLLETIEENQAEMEALWKRIGEEEQRGAASRGIERTVERLQNIEDLWPHMTQQERQNILRAVIDRIVLTDDLIEVRYQFPA